MIKARNLQVGVEHGAPMRKGRRVKQRHVGKIGKDGGLDGGWARKRLLAEWPPLEQPLRMAGPHAITGPAILATITATVRRANGFGADFFRRALQTPRRPKKSGLRPHRA
jgi:hypothetical protein